MIKYIGSKRRLLPVIAPMAAAGGAKCALDLFSGTARVGKALKEAGMTVTAVDSARYAKVLADTYVATDAAEIDGAYLEAALHELSQVPPKRGYVTETFCEKSRFFHPENGRRIDAVRQAIEERYAETPLYPLLLTSLIEAADRVDSTTGVQMAYLKSFASRALKPLELRAPSLVAGRGRAYCGLAEDLAPVLGSFDVAYLDPPYNQHQYRSNYHVWETIVAWDAPSHYGVACKREDCRDVKSASLFNRRREMPDALRRTLFSTKARLILVSYNDEAFLPAAELVSICAERAALSGGTTAAISVCQPRYVGAVIGIHNQKGLKVGSVSHRRNNEIIVAIGERDLVSAACETGLEAAERAGFEAVAF